MIYYGSRCAGIYNIATVSEMRGRGYGTALTGHLLAQAKERGCDTAVLTSSKIGRSVYERLGFREVAEIDNYGPT